MKLFEKLNALKHLTPDEIVARLSNNGWIRGKDMTKAEREAMKGKEVMLCIHTQGPDLSLAYLWGPRQYVFTWSHRNVLQDLKDYQFILVKDYRDGVLPQPHPAS